MSLLILKSTGSPCRAPLSRLVVTTSFLLFVVLSNVGELSTLPENYVQTLAVLTHPSSQCP